MNDLVCLHAAGSGPATWDRVRPPLADLGYRVHCPPLLGHRDAPRRRPYTVDAFRDEVLAELDRRALDRVTLVGHSLGGVVACALTGLAPDRVERLVLEEMPVPPRDDRDGPPSRTRTSGVALRALALLGHRRVDPHAVRDALAELRRPQPDWWHALGSITAPTLILTGGAASHLDQTRFSLVVQAIPTATVAPVEVGHRIHSTAPDRWLPPVTEFLSR